MKFKDGYMISSGQPVKDYIDSAVRHVLLRQVSLSSNNLIGFLLLLAFHVSRSFGLLWIYVANVCVVCDVGCSRH